VSNYTTISSPKLPRKKAKFTEVSVSINDGVPVRNHENTSGVKKIEGFQLDVNSMIQGGAKLT
jgi:hypothetical protein